jgi:[histone H3]-lysine36 N-dimethyltransferase SETMAR
LFKNLNMSEFVPTKTSLRGILLHYFLRKTTAAKAHRISAETYGDNTLSKQTFKNSVFDLEDGERPGAPKKFEDDELEALLDEDPCQTQEELAETLGVEQQTISHRLKQLE